MAKFSELVGKTLTDVRKDGNEALFFVTSDGDEYRMHHDQDCCESVTIDDIEGDLQSLIGNPILVAEEVTSRDVVPGLGDRQDADESFTWTFYKLATIKGHVDIRWFGTSNGYYSESVDFNRKGESRFIAW